MNYKKIGETLFVNGCIDNRKLMCHSNANITTSKNYVVFVKMKTISQRNLPSFMILSICNEKLYISKARIMGGFKEIYAYINLATMKYIQCTVIDFFIKSYEFLIEHDDGTKSPFYINVSKKKNEAQKLVDAIISFNENEKVIDE